MYEVLMNTIGKNWLPRKLVLFYPNEIFTSTFLPTFRVLFPSGH